MYFRTGTRGFQRSAHRAARGIGAPHNAGFPLPIAGRPVAIAYRDQPSPRDGRARFLAPGFPDPAFRNFRPLETRMSAVPAMQIANPLPAGRYRKLPAGSGR